MTGGYEGFKELMQARFSCRAFLPDVVDTDTITQFVDAARHAPSWCNAQPWQVTITTGEQTDRFREALFKHASSSALPAPDLPWPKGYPGVYGERRRTCGWQLYEAVGVEKGDRAGSAREMMKNFRLFDAPHVAIVHSPKDLGEYGAMDTGGFVTAFCVAATALGVATVPQAAVASHAPFVREWFGIGEERLILCAISFGRADIDHPANTFRTERATLDALIDWKD